LSVSASSIDKRVIRYNKREDDLIIGSFLKFLESQKGLKKLQITFSALKISRETLRELVNRITQLLYPEELVLGIGLCKTILPYLPHDIVFPYLVKSEIRIYQSLY